MRRNEPLASRRFYIYKIAHPERCFECWVTSADEVHLMANEVVVSEQEHREICQGNLFLNEMGHLVPIKEFDSEAVGRPPSGPPPRTTRERVLDSLASMGSVEPNDVT